MKACPFCGGTNIDPSFSSGWFQGDPNRPEIAAGCEDCGAVGPHVPGTCEDARERSIRVWRSRAPRLDVEQDPIAHIFPDDIERLQATECTVTAYSVAHDRPDGAATIALYIGNQRTQR